MNIKCDKCSPCDELIPPYINLSSESPDRDFFIGLYFNGDPPPFGGDPDFSPPPGCVGIAFSDVDQATADACAGDLAKRCFLTNPIIPDPNPCGVGGPVPIGKFGNDQQECSTNCPDGSVFTYTIPVGSYFSTSKALANQKALQQACKKALDKVICITDLTQESGCVNNAFFASLNITNSSTISTILVVGALPAGLTPFVDTVGKQVTITGIPTAPGDSTFSVQAFDKLGNYTTKTLRICITQITPDTSSLPDGSVGTAYSQQLNAILGFCFPGPTWSWAATGLPPGLSISPVTGLITGTPTTTGTYTVSVMAIHT
jgi:hypothetical protein